MESPDSEFQGMDSIKEERDCYNSQNANHEDNEMTVSETLLDSGLYIHDPG